MFFLTYILSELRRRSGRTILTALGLDLGLGALDRPTAGELLFEGRDIGRLGDRELSRLRLGALGFVFQQFNLIPTLTAAQNVEVALAPTSASQSERRARVLQLLGSVGLAERAAQVGAGVADSGAPALTTSS